MANKHRKRCLTPLIIREMKIKTMIRYHLTQTKMDVIKIPQTTNNGEGAEKREHCW